MSTLALADEPPTPGWRGFFTGTGLPLFMLTAATVYEAFLLAIVFWPESTTAWGGFAREFKQWCFQYDARTGGMEWAAIAVMLVEPAFVVIVAAWLWRRGLRPLRTWSAWRRQRSAVASGAAAALLVMTGLYAYGRPASGVTEEQLPFPGERIRTALPAPEVSGFDQKGRAFAFPELQGRVTLVTGVYALCSTACPEILQELRTLLSQLPPAARSQLSVVALSLNPEYETSALMDSVADAYGFGYPEFRYVNGAPAMMHEALTRAGFSAVRNRQTGVIDHANLFLLMDARGRIAYRFTLDARHRRWLREAIVALAAEAASS